MASCCFSLFELGGAGGGAGFELGDALLVGVLPRGGALELDGALAGAGAGLLGAGVELVAAGDAGGVLGVERSRSARRAASICVVRRGDLVVERCRLFGVHLRDAAGEHDAEAACAVSSRTAA